MVPPTHTLWRSIKKTGYIKNTRVCERVNDPQHPPNGAWIMCTVCCDVSLCWSQLMHTSDDFAVLEQYAKSPNWTPRQEMKQPLFWKAIRAEFMGSLILMVFSSSSDNYIGPICYGCTVVVLTYSFKATNPHFNPVISLAALLLRSLTPFRCCSVTLAQTLGEQLYHRSGRFFHHIGYLGIKSGLHEAPDKNYFWQLNHSFVANTARNIIQTNITPRNYLWGPPDHGFP